MRLPLRAGRLAVVLVALVFSAAPSRAAVFNPETFTLANGLQVVVVTNRRAPIVTHMVWYKVGSADEPTGKSGLAHFLEHLMFKGTKKVAPDAFSNIIARNGGEDNAFTTDDYTAYFERVARDKLDLVMRLEADRMQNLTLSESQVLSERKVVLEERHSRIGNQPGALLNEEARAVLYLNHPYRIPVIGWRNEIKKLTRQDALDFYHHFYVPNNAVVVVVGDVDAAEVRPLAEKYYGPIPRGAKIVRRRPAEPEHHATKRVELTSARVRLPSWSKTWIAPSYRTETGREAYALEVLAQVLGGGATSRLYRSLVIDKGVAASAMAWYDPAAYDSGNFGVAGTPRPGKDVATLEKAMLAEVQRVIDKGVTADEVDRAKKLLQAQAIYARDSLSAAANVLGRALATGQTIDDVESWPERIGAVTPAEVAAAARHVLIDVEAVTAVLLPKKGS